MNTTTYAPDWEIVEVLLGLLRIPPEALVLDVTYGRGKCWLNSKRRVIGNDKDLTRARHVCADFKSLPFPDKAFKAVVYDPPYHPRGKSRSLSGRSYGFMGVNNATLRTEFVAGLKEARRVTSDALLLKCQDYVNGGKPQWLSLWAIDALGEPFEWAIGHRRVGPSSGKWRRQYSLRRNHVSWLAFVRGSTYRRRGP